MTTPTGLISLTHVVTEFGGTTPHSMNEYYRGGSFIPINQAPGTGGTVPTSATISMSHLRGLTKITVQDPIGGSPQAWGSSDWDTNSPYAYVIFYPNGVNRGYAHFPAVNWPGTIMWTDSWASPQQTGIGSQFYIRATRSGDGALIGDPLNTWLSLSVERSWGIQGGGGAFTAGNWQSTFTISISSTSSGSPILASGTFTISVEAADSSGV